MSYQVCARLGSIRVTVTTDSDNPLDLDDIAAVARRECIALNDQLLDEPEPEPPSTGLSHYDAMRHDYLLDDE